MRCSIKTAPMHTTWEAIRDVWVEADGIDVFDAGWTFDHFVPIAGDPAGPCLEGWSVLAALAAVTRRLRLGVMVTGNTYRHPAVLANMAATVDVVSGGRLELGLGAGWHEEEHESYGIDLPPLRQRFDRFDEALEVIHLLLTEPVANFSGAHYQLTEARCDPKPVQRPRPPLVIGGKGERRTLGAAARWADQWNYPRGEPDEFRRLVAVLAERCSEVGRPPEEIEVSVQVFADPDPAVTAAEAAAFAEAGAEHVIVGLRAPFDPADLGPLADALTRELGPLPKSERLLSTKY
jgi:F420-dependent oxidoreductase-like protein